jgi:hypothetical protein
MKKVLVILGTIAIGAIGMFCCHLWMQPGFSFAQFVCLLIGSYIVAGPTYDYWHNKLNS